MSPLPPHIRRRHKSPYDKQVLGVAVRRAESAQAPAPLKLTESRATLMRAIANGEVKAGQGQYVGDWRHDGATVTARVVQLIKAGWAEPVRRHVELTEAGTAALGGAA